jgi:hypothetical protein
VPFVAGALAGIALDEPGAAVAVVVPGFAPPGASDEPHEPQNRWSGGLAVPQVGHATGSGLPHVPQNRWPGAAVAPQLLQVTASLLSPPSWPEG